MILIYAQESANPEDKANTRKKNIRYTREVRQRVTGRSSHQCSSLSKSTSMFQVVNVSVLVPKVSSAFTKAILLERSKAIYIVKLI